MDDPERIRRLALIADAIDQHLPPDWVYLAFVAKADDVTGTFNVISNATYELTDEIIKASAERYLKGYRPKPLPEP